MSEKMRRNSGSNYGRISYDHRTTPANLESLVSNIMDLCSAPSSKRRDLECLLSRHMKQEDDFAVPEEMLFSSGKRNSKNQIHVTGPKSLQLKFSTNISQPVFTGVPIKGKYQPLKVELIDTRSGKVVKFGPEAWARVQIMALEADFGGFLSDNWASEEFKNKIITKEGNKRLLTGNLVLYLNEGIGFLDSVQFSHTKTWKTKRAYRLGAMATDYNMGIKIREGFTDSFEVRDHRLDLNRKHYPPILSDEVWRLESIARDGAFHQRLSDDNFKIKTVEDLLKILNMDPHKLRDILGKGMYAKNWEALVNHAQTCIIDKRLYFYSSPESSVLFNMVGQVMGQFSNSQYRSFEMLSESEKAHAMNLVASAFQQWENVVSFNDEASFVKYLGPSNINYHLQSPVRESSMGINILIPPKNNEFGVPQPAISFEDKASLFDESPGPSNIVYPPNSLTTESFGDNNIIITSSPNFNELDFPKPAISFEDKESLFNESTSLSKIICPPKSFIQESSSGTQILISQENEFDLSRLPFYSNDDAILFDESPFRESSSGCNNSNCDSIWDMSYYNDYNSSQRTDSEMTDSENLEFCEENFDLPLQFSVDDVTFDTHSLFPESLGNPQNEGNGPLMTLPDASYALIANSTSYNAIIDSWVMCPNQINSMSSACPFHKDEYVEQFNISCLLQPRNRMAMNKLGRRKYAADRSFI